MHEEFPKTPILDCSHCGNRTPHTLKFQYEAILLYDELDDETKWTEPYTWLAYTCGTCHALNIFGAFYGIDTHPQHIGQTKLYPRGESFLPPPHTLSPNQPVPQNVVKLYTEIWPLRHRAPVAFIGQIRRLLEYICTDQGSTGSDLHKKLQDLANKGTLPGYFQQISDLLRKVGNLGAHATDTELSRWDAELIDEFFRSILDYVYIAPARIRRMEERLRSHEEADREPE